MEFIDWLCEAVDASTYGNTYLQPTKKFVMAMASKTMLFQPMSATTIKAIVETKTLMTCIALGFFIIFTVGYSRSPWRKLPPSGPWRLPILGNVLQLRDKTWLLSKDCRERFGGFTHLYAQVDANDCLRKSQERSCTLTVLGSP